MPVSVIVGGQFGSEGKGKVAYWVCRHSGAAAAVRVGGPNSGHTVVGPNGEILVFRQLPTAAILPDTWCFLPAGSFLDVDLTLAEINFSRISPDRVVIDPYASVITKADRMREERLGLVERIGSTGVGVAAALTNRLERRGIARFAKDEPRLGGFIGNVAGRLRHLLLRGERVVG